MNKARLLTGLRSLPTRSLVVVMLLVFLVTPLNSVQAQYINSYQDNCSEELLRDLGVAVVNCTGNTACTPTGAIPTRPGGSVGGSLFVFGDSITHGMRIQTPPNDLATNLNASGWQTDNSMIDAVPGEDLRWGISRVPANAQVLGAVGSVLINLGTNNLGDVVRGNTPVAGGKEVVKGLMEQMIADIKAVNQDITIYWTNFYMTGELRTDWGRFNMDVAMPILNEALNEVAAQHNIPVLRWDTRAVAPGTPDEPAIPFPDGLHPGNYPAMADFIVKELRDPPAAGTNSSTSSGSCSCGPGSGSSGGGAGGTYSATVWRAVKELPAQWIPILQMAGDRFGVDPAVLAALLSIETGWDTPESFASNPRRNSASATGPFQFIDQAARDFMPAPDQWYSGSGAFTSRVIRQLNNDSEFEQDGSYVVDGNKDGIVDRATPEDAALMAAAFMKSLGVDSATELGAEGDYRVPRRADANPMTVRLAGAYYNQGTGWSAPNATTAAEVNARAQGNNDVAHYMDQMWEVTKAGRESGVYSSSGGGGSCSSQPATGDAARYIQDCGANNGNAAIACTAINELTGIRYPNTDAGEFSDRPENPNPQILDCSGLGNMAIYRTFGHNPGTCSFEYTTSDDFQTINVHDIQPGDFVGKGTLCGTNSAGVSGHVAIVVSYDATTRELVTVETGSTRYLSGVRDGSPGSYRVGLQADGNGSYTWAVRYVGPKG